METGTAKLRAVLCGHTANLKAVLWRLDGKIGGGAMETETAQLRADYGD